MRGGCGGAAGHEIIEELFIQLESSVSWSTTGVVKLMVLYELPGKEIVRTEGYPSKTGEV